MNDEHEDPLCVDGPPVHRSPQAIALSRTGRPDSAVLVYTARRPESMDIASHHRPAMDSYIGLHGPADVHTLCQRRPTDRQYEQSKSQRAGD